MMRIALTLNYIAANYQTLEEFPQPLVPEKKTKNQKYSINLKKTADKVFKKNAKNGDKILKKIQLQLEIMQ